MSQDNLKNFQSWSLIILCYNEEKTIKKVCEEACSFLKPLPDNKKEILVIDDGSTDQSIETIKDMVSSISYLKIHRHTKNLGIGEALKSGYKLAQMENVCAVPADGQFDINELRVIRNIPDNTIISFFRTSYPGYSLSRLIVTKMNRILMKLLFRVNIKDVNWVKVYKQSSIKNLNLISKSSFIESEIIYKLAKNKHKIKQIPSLYLKRTHSYSKAIRFSILKMVLKDIISVSLNLNKLKIHKKNQVS